MNITRLMKNTSVIKAVSKNPYILTKNTHSSADARKNTTKWAVYCCIVNRKWLIRSHSPTKHAEKNAFDAEKNMFGPQKSPVKVIVFRHRFFNGKDEFSCAKPCACCTKMLRHISRRRKITISYTKIDTYSNGSMVTVKIGDLSDGAPSAGTKKRYAKKYSKVC